MGYQLINTISETAAHNRIPDTAEITTDNTNAMVVHNGPLIWSTPMLHLLIGINLIKRLTETFPAL
jgi:hypothetical protein